MKTIYALILALFIIPLSGCDLFKPKISDTFKSALFSYLKSAGQLNERTQTGINIITLQTQFAETKSAYEIVDNLWPKDFAPESRSCFQRSIVGYGLALHLWTAIIKDYDGESLPTQPDKNGWELYNAYLGNRMICSEMNNKIVLYDKQNVARLFAMAGESFMAGRTDVLEKLNK